MLCWALCRLSCGVEVLLAFLPYGSKEKGRRKETKKNQALSAVIDIHVCRRTISEVSCVNSNDGCVCSSLCVASVRSCREC